MRIRTLEFEGKGALRIDELGRSAKRDSIKIGWLPALDRLQELPIRVRIDLAQLVVGERLAKVCQAGPISTFVAIIQRLRKLPAQLVASGLLACLECSRAAVLRWHSLSVRRTRCSCERGQA